MSSMQGFTSYDKADGLGVRAQVVVTKGELPVKKITLNISGTMAKIDFDAESAGFKYAIHANIPVTDRAGSKSAAFSALEAASVSGESIKFRIETQRKKGIDRRLPFPPAKDSERDSSVKYLETQAGVEVVKILVTAGDVVTDEIRTDTSEDDRWLNIVRSMAPPFIDENPVASLIASSGLNPELVLAQYVAVVKADFPIEMTRIIGALAIAAGATLEEFYVAAHMANNKTA